MNRAEEVPFIDDEVSIHTDGVILEGTLTLPPGAHGLVIFAHGSGSSRHSSRNIFVAEELNGVGIGTLLIDLLTEAEEHVDNRTSELRFDIDLLSRRVTGAVDWALADSRVAKLPIGLFGASTGAAAALQSAANRPEDIHAIVSRGGRPDLAQQTLGAVRAPALLIVGSNDETVIQFNQEAFEQLYGCEKELVVICGATHLFDEPGSLEEAAGFASRWFLNYLPARS
ncbi:dienelactone hydrolase family protein [soil metagenome]